MKHSDRKWHSVTFGLNSCDYPVLHRRGVFFLAEKALCEHRCHLLVEAGIQMFLHKRQESERPLQVFTDGASLI